MSPKILVVDDDPLIQSMTRSALQRVQFRGRSLHLIQAMSAEEGRSLYQANPDIAVILLDVSMEYETAGLDFYQWVREQGHSQPSPAPRHHGDAGDLNLSQFEKPIILRTSQSSNFSQYHQPTALYPVTGYREKVELANPKRLQNVLVSNLITHSLQQRCRTLPAAETRNGWDLLAELGQETGSYFFTEPMESAFKEKWPISIEMVDILALTINGLRRLRSAVDDQFYDLEAQPSPVLILENQSGIDLLSSFRRDHPRRDLLEQEARPVDQVSQEKLRALGWNFQPWWALDTAQADPGDYTKWCTLARIGEPIASTPPERP